MKFKLRHPLWVHIPPIIMLAVFLVRVHSLMPLPKSIPVHFDLAGKANRMGSPWEIICVIAGMSIFYILLSVLFDEMWAKHEKKKRFNWFSLFDDVTVGFLCAVGYCNIGLPNQRDQIFTFPWQTVLIFVVPAVILAIYLDSLRKFNPEISAPATEDTSALESAISEQMQSGQQMVHWESQHMPIMTIPMSLAGAGFLIASAFNMQQPIVRNVMLFNGLIFIAIAFVFHGITITVTPEEIQVRLETLKAKVLTLKVDEIAEVSVLTFSPIADFGGWGIRANLKMKGYYWRGNKGALLTMKNGKKYLIGSDNAERLAAVIRGMMCR